MRVKVWRDILEGLWRVHLRDLSIKTVCQTKTTVYQTRHRYKDYNYSYGPHISTNCLELIN